MQKLSQWCNDVLEQILPVFIFTLMLFTTLLIFMVVVVAMVNLWNLMIDSGEPNLGCIASAYQATQNGFDLEANLAVCN
jgi:hypothetical protein